MSKCVIMYTYHENIIDISVSPDLASTTSIMSSRCDDLLMLDILSNSDFVIIHCSILFKILIP